jgi:hypothetical protein
VRKRDACSFALEVIEMSVRKFMCALIAGFLLFLAPVGLSQAAELGVVLKDFIYADEAYLLHYGLTNTYTYDWRVTVAFKIMHGGKPIACSRMETTVPAGSDGSKDLQVTIPGPDKGRDVTVESLVFHRSNRNRVGYWLADCPEESP